MKLKRDWVTPLVGGSFFIIAVTGILMFFHIEVGFNKVAHEWLGLLMVAAVILHIMLNFKGFQKSFENFSGKVINGIFIILLALSFLSIGEKQDKPFVLPIKVMAEVDLEHLSQISRIGVDELIERLQALSSIPINAQSNVDDVAKGDMRKQMELLNKILQ